MNSDSNPDRRALVSVWIFVWREIREMVRMAIVIHRYRNRFRNRDGDRSSHGEIAIGILSRGTKNR